METNTAIIAGVFAFPLLSALGLACRLGLSGPRHRMLDVPGLVRPLAGVEITPPATLVLDELAEGPLDWHPYAAPIGTGVVWPESPQ